MINSPYTDQPLWFSQSGYFLCFLCAQTRRRTFFITSGEDEVFDILHSLGLAFIVELVEAVQ
jgi:hypothetical protein